MSVETMRLANEMAASVDLLATPDVAVSPKREVEEEPRASIKNERVSLL